MSFSARRLAIEREIMAQYFPGFAIERAEAIGTLTSNAGRRYGLRVTLRGFPNRVPEVFVTSPILVMHSGRTLASLGPSGSMHVLQADVDGSPAICHFLDALWTPTLTIYNVVMKARIWLEAWERHVATGEPLDKFLPHVAL